MSKRDLARKLKILWRNQKGRCKYCLGKTWVHSLHTKVQAREMLGISAGARKGAKRLRWAQATIDHIIPRSLGGGNTWRNVVMACNRCNSSRGIMPMDEFKALKRKELEDAKNQNSGERAGVGAAVHLQAGDPILP